MCSIAASMATMAFNKAFSHEVAMQGKRLYTEYLNSNDASYIDVLEKAMNKGAMFDARCFNIPKEEVANLIYWRQLDAARNSIQMVGQAYFSHNELHGKNQNDIQEMLWSAHGVNWNDYPTHLKRGSCCIKVETTYAKNKDNIAVAAFKGRPHWEIDLNIPMFKGVDRKYINDLIGYEEDYTV